MSGTGTRFYRVIQIGGFVYSKNTLEIGLAAAKAERISYIQEGTVISCPTLTDLENLYTLFFTGPNEFNNQVWNNLNTRFRDMGNRAYFKVNGMVVQIWALVTQVEGKLTEGAGQAPVWLPVYCSFDASDDPVFDEPRVASLDF